MSWGQQSYGSYRPPPQGGYGGPPQQQYGNPPAQYGAPPPRYGNPPPQQYGGSPQQYGGQPPQQGGYPPQQGYPPGGGPRGYGPPPPTNAPPGIDPTLWEWFQSVDSDRSGQISAIELRQALLNSNWSHFNEETCRLLIGMFDKDQNGTIDVYEFGALWKYVQEWKGCFDRFDTDKSGNISCDELSAALSSFGYRLSPQFCQLCTRVFDRKDTKTMKFDDFIQCCVMLKSLTESFQRMDTDRDGVIDVQYEQFLTMAIENSIVS